MTAQTMIQTTNIRRTTNFALYTFGLILMLMTFGQSTATAKTITVTGTGDTIAVDGLVTLREAITAANTNMASGDAEAGDAGLDTIAFQIGTGLQTIQPQSQLPIITDPVIIDGTTQPGFSGAPLIELDGSQAGEVGGIEISAGNSTVRGLILNRWRFRAIWLHTNGSNLIAGNYIGTNAAGTASAITSSAENNNGIGVFVNSANNIVGGTTPADRNIVSGNINANGGQGVWLYGVVATGNKVIGNYIGTDVTGTISIGQGNNAMWLTNNTSNNIIGGTMPGERNVISGNAGAGGISFFEGNNNKVQGNYIGVKADGTGALGNSYGIYIQGLSVNNLIGGINPGEGNVIAFNTQRAVAIVSSEAINNAVLGNSIYSNSNLGIDLIGDGVTPNDEGATINDASDADTGANNLQNFPVITSVMTQGSNTVVDGTLRTEANKTYRIELFSNTSCTGTNLRQGRYFVASTLFMTDANGNGSFSFSVSTASITGTFFTTTATDPNNNTSESSACGTVAPPPAGVLQFNTNSVTVNESVGAGGININVTRTGGSTGTVMVNYATANGSATAPDDYTATSGTLTFTDGQTSKTINIPVNNDTTSEPAESFSISLSNPTGGATLGSPTTATLNINDNDAPTISISDVSVTEGNAGTVNANFTVSLSGAHFQTVTMNYATDVTGTATSGADYQPTSGPLTFNPGETMKTVTVQVNGDTSVESNETFFVKLSNNNALSFSDSTGMGTIVDDDLPNPAVEFSQSSYNVQEDQTSIQITVTRNGNTTVTTTVDYATGDKTATQVNDYTIARGQLTFAPGETSKTFRVLINEDSFVEGNEQLEVVLSNPSGTATLGAKTTATVTISDDATEPAANVITDAQNFVSQQYHDFLNREPDAAGLQFWTANITKCNDPAQRPAGQTLEQCIDKQRVTTSAAFFLSPEFQATGVFVYHFYKGSLVGAPNYDAGGTGRFPTYEEFMRDVQRVSRGIIVGGQISAAVLEQNKAAFAQEFVTRPEFKARYDGLSNTLYVQGLFNVTGATPTASEFNALVAGLNNQTETRASVLFKVVDGTVFISEGNIQFTTAYGQSFTARELNRAFVLMEYFGYMRRDPDAAGYNHWLGKLNFYGNYIDAEMVRSFIVSPEYRQRFGQ